MLEEQPPKQITDETVKPNGEQSNICESVRSAMKKRAGNAVQATGLPKSRITVLNVLLKLRQVCCDPKLEAARKVKESTKCNRLIEMPGSFMSKERKVPISNRFLQMPRVLEEDAKAAGWKYATLYGSN